VNHAMARTDAVRLEATKYGLLRDRLREQYPSLDDETLSDTLEESPTFASC